MCKVIFMSNPTKVMLGGVELWLSYGSDNKTPSIFCILYLTLFLLKLLRVVYKRFLANIMSKISVAATTCAHTW